ncbi:DUF2232 domain-containing protein [Bacillus mangrovi]|uniref:DUF2232 domain-containing protein n=1 Tax=Metabacillus mangrovi TaxID=1491830 RepID=A0A7X2S6G0_9BACI|nr:YybS family protein [Metabacillus mangrovi]MTH54145.1 DUF2232 domain-containing protein [Metabacillus mangrovi]
MKKTNALTEGAVLLALFAAAVFLTQSVPPLGVILVVVLPLPFIVYALKHDVKYTLVMLIASIPVVFLTGTFNGLVLALPAGLMGAVMGTLYKKKGSMAAVAGGALSFVASFLIGMAVSVFFFGFNPLEEMRALVDASFRRSFTMLESLGRGLSDKQQAMYFEQLEQAYSALPFSIIAGGFMAALIQHKAARVLLKRLRMTVPALKPFREWKLPASIGWYYLAVILLGYFRFEEGTFMHSAFINGFYLLTVLLIIQGLSFVFYYAHVKGKSKGIPVITVIAALMIPFLLYPLQFLGIIDIGFKLRERIARNS